MNYIGVKVLACHICGEYPLVEIKIVKLGKEIVIVGGTDIGLKRDLNEDNYLISGELGLAVVADGMGGHHSGEIASKIAIEEIYKFILSCQKDDVHIIGCFDNDFKNYKSSKSIVQNAIDHASQRIYSLNQAQNNNYNSGMGTTVITFQLDFENNQFISGHVGDSRLYRHRNGRLNRLTRDHSAFQNWVDAGKFGNPPPKNIISRALGPTYPLKIDVTSMRFKRGDIYILCSDGLHDMLSDEKIEAVLNKMSEPRNACTQLIEMANKLGGFDNITVIIVQL